MKADLVIVGAGLSGAVLAERAATQLGWRVLVVERRQHIAGNAYDYVDEHGVRVHRYGPHVFHTNSSKVWNYLSQFTRWQLYEHRVRALVLDQLVPLPFNLTSVSRLFSRARARTLRDALIREYGFGAGVTILRMQQCRSRLIRWLADFVYQHVYLGYTTKQWGLRPEELDASVTGRVPIRISHDDRYFTDRFQALPVDGYAEMVARMLAHRNIEVMLGTDFHDVAGQLRYGRLVYTGPIDRFFDYDHGELPYRSLQFRFRHVRQRTVQPVGAITYPNQHGYTRSCEFKFLTGQRVDGSTLSFEYPLPHCPDVTEPYYPIPRPENHARYELYRHEADRLPAVVFCGRLATYRYLNMDQAVAAALTAFERQLAPADHSKANTLQLQR